MRTTSWLSGVCERLFQAKARSRASLRNARYPAQAEILETRQLLAAVITLNAGGWVKIDGTEQDDVATVEAVDADNIRIRVVTGVETVEQTFAKTALTNHIDFDALGGHDRLTNTTTDRRVTMSGGDGNDTLLGGPFVDGLNGGAGDDYFDGGMGNDQAFGGDGNDSLVGGGGSDLLKGENGNDTINADSGNDTVSGGDGSDSLNGGSGTDQISESFSTPTQYVLVQNSASSTDFVKNCEFAAIGGSGSNDRIDLSGFTFPTAITGGDGSDTLIGGSHNDYIVGGNGTDSLVGGAGNDSLAGNNDRDTMSGGVGDDLINGGQSDDMLIESGDASMTLTDTSMTGGLGNDRVTLMEFVQLTGGNGNNTIDTSGFTRGFVTLVGGAGDDTIVGSPVGSLMTGGLGNDTLTGGLSNTSLSSNATGYYNTVQEMGDDIAVIDGVLTEHIPGVGTFTDQHIGLGSNGKIELIGGPGNSRLSVQGRYSSLRGNDGDDTLSASHGQMRGGNGTDLVVMTVSGSVELTAGSGSFSLANRTIYDVEVIDVTGDNAPNKIDVTRYTGQAILRGLGGNDTLMGCLGNDTLIGGEGDDSLDGGYFGTGLDRAVAQADANLTATGNNNSNSAQITGEGTDTLVKVEQVELIGGASNNVLDASGYGGTAFLHGADGDDTLLGTAGNDTLDGGLGTDSLVGGAGSDRLWRQGELNFNVVLTNSSLTATGPWYGTDVDLLNSVEKAQLVRVPDATHNRSGILNASAFSLGGVTLVGSTGNDTLYGSTKGDSLDGGAGIDWLIAKANVNFMTLNDTLMTGLGNDLLARIEQAQLTGGAGNNAFDAAGFTGQTTLSGLAGNDTLQGGSGNDVLAGGDGDDVLVGRGGNDSNHADPGNDRFDAGDGDDVYTDGPGDDFFSGGAGNDTIADYANVASFETDRFDGDDGRDTLVYLDNVTATVTVTDSQITIALPTLTGSQPLSSVDVVKFVGLSGLLDASACTTVSVFVNGLSGNDTFIGGAGDDTLNGQGGDDSLIGNGGHDSLNGGDGNDTLNAGEGNNKLLGGNGDDSLIAGDGNDLLDGGVGIDTISSGLGTDTLLRIEVGD